MSSISKNVIRFFKLAGINKRKDVEFFWKNIEKQFGNLGRSFREAIAARSDGQAVNPYEVRDASLELSLAVYSQYEADFASGLMSWIEEVEIEVPKRVLDIGCGNGVIACFMANLWPDTHVTGIDTSLNSIRCAEELARKLKLGNVKFEFGNAKDYFAKYNQSDIDMVLTSKVLQEVFTEEVGGFDLACPEDAFDTYEEIERLPELSANLIEFLNGVKAVLSDNGKYISVDRCGIPAAYVFLCRHFKEAGLGLIPARCEKIVGEDVGGYKESFPLSFLKKTPLAAEPSTEIIISLHKKMLLSEKLECINPVDGFVAEALYLAIGDKRPVHEAELIYRNGSGIMKMHLFHSEILAGVYKTTSRGMRQLEIVPLAEASAVVDAYFNEISKLSEYCDINENVSLDSSLLNQLGLEVVQSKA
ncbi:class I SAM-dependent methyltransferase [Noviherbaspirillum sp. 1P10PC]|uniref:methyltransferase domain-containing protein n=1 Tax=Noviherbaspirillum sp. 1P10PC TaxID=3132292 RepID=UPI0039A0D3A4